jgi:PleD family two-component response regulator
MEIATTGDPVVAVEDFRKAKIEHYLDRVEELIGMARYSAARALLAKIFDLEPHDRAALILQQHIDVAVHQLAALTFQKKNGHRPGTKRSELILVVDQDERILASLTESLRRYGYGAICAASFEEALEVLAQHRPHLIISEVNFADGSVGFDLYSLVRNNVELSSIPFLYLATRVTREMLIAGKRMGVDEFIVKPLDEEVVMASVHNCLEKKKRRFG